MKTLENQLENRVAQLLDSMGFKVSRHEKLIGRSGLLHMPDLTFEANGKKFIVECKIDFSRQDILSVYGKVTDSDVSHVFLVGKRLPPELLSYSKKFDLTLIVLEDDYSSEKNFKYIIKHTIDNITSIEKEGLTRGRFFELSLNSYYFHAPKGFGLDRVSAPLPRGELTYTVVSDDLNRIDFIGPGYRANSYIRAIAKTRPIEKLSFPETVKVRDFLQHIEERYGATVARFGMVTIRAYIVTNLRSMRDKIEPDEIAKTLLEQEGELTSLNIRLPQRDYLNISRSPSLNLRYRGMNQGIYLKLREAFEHYSFRR